MFCIVLSFYTNLHFPKLRAMWIGEPSKSTETGSSFGRQSYCVLTYPSLIIQTHLKFRPICDCAKDPEMGPRVYTYNGEMSFFSLKNLVSNSTLEVPQKQWKDRTAGIDTGHIAKQCNVFHLTVPIHQEKHFFLFKANSCLKLFGSGLHFLRKKSGWHLSEDPQVKWSDRTW